MLKRQSLPLRIAIFLFLYLSFSCQRDNSNNNLSPYELITSHKWKLFREGEKTGNNPIVWNFPDNCQKDNIWDFRTNGRLVIDEGATKCSPTDPQLWFDGTWELVTNNKYIDIHNGVLLEIVTLTSTSLQLIEIDGGPSQTRFDCYDLIPY